MGTIQPDLVEQGRTGRADGYGVGLTIRVLGPTRVERDGASAAIGGPRQRAVLTRLVLAEGQLVTAERLIDDVWGDEAPKSVVSTLQGFLSLLRRALGDPDLLRRDGPGYVLAVGPAEVDALAYERLVTEARQVSVSDPTRALAMIDRAELLWRGPAYADVRDTEWGRAAAVRLDELRLAGAETRFDALLDLGRNGEAVVALERAVEEHPLNERFAAQHILGLYRSGRQAAALRAFDRTRERLLDELGVDPGPELLRLQAAILDHDESIQARLPDPAPVDEPRPEQRVRAEAAASPVRLPAAAAHHRDRPFVGRAADLEVLHEAWRDARSGRRRFVVVSGEAGVGKTRLVGRFAAEAHQEGAVVMWGRATSEAIIPYEALVEGFRSTLRTVSPEAQQRVVSGRGALSLLVPDLPDLVDGTKVVRPEVGTERYVLFETVAELLEEESAANPIVFVVDDLHGSDQLTLRLLAHLLHHERQAHLLLIGTVRTVPASSNPELDALLADLSRDGLATRINLAGLDEPEVTDLLAATGWQGGSADAVHRATGGNPFFVTELAEQGGEPEGASLPDSVREVLGARLDRLDEETWKVVALAAVAGPVAPLPVLMGAADVSAEAVLDAVDLAITEGVLTEDGPTGSVTFPHGLVRFAVLDRLTAARRCAMHLTIADALIESGDATKSELAHHLVSAGRLAPRTRVAEAAIAAGCEALPLLAYEAADRWAEQAIEAAGDTGPAELRCRALLLRSDSQRALGLRPEARQAALDAVEAARESGDPILLTRAAEGVALARAGIGFDGFTVESGLDQILAEAIEALPDSEGGETQLLGASASRLASRGDTTALERLSRLVVRLPDPDAQPVLVATVYLARRMASWRLDVLDERLADDRAAAAAARRSQSAPLELNALLYGITDLTEAGEIAEAAEWLDRYRVRAAEIRQPVYDAFALFMDATRLLLEGDYAAASQLADDALALGRTSHGVNAEQAWAGHVFVHAWDRGRLADLVEVVSRLEGPHGQPIWQVALGACALAAGDPGPAREVLAELVTDHIDVDDNSLWLTNVALLIELARGVGDTERAEVLLREFTPYAGRVVISGLGRVSLGPAARFVGAAALAAGRPEEAEAFLLQSAELCRLLRARPNLARTWWDLAEVKAAVGDDTAAADLRTRARELAEPLGLVLGPLGPLS